VSKGIAAGWGRDRPWGVGSRPRAIRVKVAEGRSRCAKNPL